MTTQDPELSAALGWPGGISEPVLDRKVLLQQVAALRAALAQQAEPVQEPVAWSGYDLDGMVEAFSRVIEAHYQRANPFQYPIHMDAQMALRILRGFIPAMKAYAVPPQRVAQQAEPVQDQRCRAEPRSDGDFVCDCKIGECPGRSAEPAQEPVAWECKAGGLKPLTQRQYDAQTAATKRHYTRIAPPQRQPLTDATLWGMWVDSPSDVLRFARAVERAHGIKE